MPSAALATTCRGATIRGDGCPPHRRPPGLAPDVRIGPPGQALPGASGDSGRDLPAGDPGAVRALDRTRERARDRRAADRRLRVLEPVGVLDPPRDLPLRA